MSIANPHTRAAADEPWREYDDELPVGLHEAEIVAAEDDEFSDGEEAILATVASSDLKAYHEVRLGGRTEWLVRQVARIGGLVGDIEPEHLIGLRCRVRVTERNGFANVSKFLRSRLTTTAKPIADEPVVRLAEEILDAVPADDLSPNPDEGASRRRPNAEPPPF